SLEQAGVLVRRKLPPPAASRIYELNEWGYELEPVGIAVGRWGGRPPAHPRDGYLSPDSFALALIADFDASAAGDMTASVELRVGEHRFRAEVAGGRFEIAGGSASAPDATLDGDPGELGAVMWGGRPLSEAAVEVEGSVEVAERFLSL